MARPLLRTPVATTYTISDLAEEVRDGNIRVPKFQRNYRWDASDVLNLFDSIYRGYPIGSLLLWKHEAPAEVIELGTLRIEAESTSDALWVVDGQQRLTSLAGALLSVGEIDDDRFAIFFDLERESFVKGRRPPPAHWLPMNRVVDTAALLRWLGELQRAGGADLLVTRAEDLSKRIRDYRVPAYVVESDDEAALRTIFDRLNSAGKSLKSAEVFQALHGGRGGEEPEDLRTLSDDLGAHAFGKFDDNSLLRVVLALRGTDVYRDFRREFRDDENPSETFAHASRAIERMIAFLRAQAEIPHLRLLPYRYIIPVLARFFHLHPKPSQRSLTLLRRWVWRDALAPGKHATSVSAMRDVIAAVDGDENGSVQRLLKAVSRGPVEIGGLSTRLNEARTRANVAMMASWGPRSLVDGHTLNVAAYLESSTSPLTRITSDNAWKASLADRMLHEPAVSRLGELIVDSPLRRADPLSFAEALESHAVSEESLDFLRQGDPGGFLESRRETLVSQLSSTANRLAEPEANDRPPIANLVIDDGDEQ